MNGVHITGFGGFAQKSRADLHVAGLQEALHRVRGQPGAIVCLCRYAQGIYLPLEAFQTGEKEYRIDRRRVADDHLPGCIYTEPASRPAAVTAPPTSRILDPIVERLRGSAAGAGETGMAVFDADDSSAENLRPATFNGFIRSLFARSYSEVWVEEQVASGSPRLPSSAAILERFTDLLRSASLADAANVHEAAQRRGFQMAWGIIEGRIPIGDDGGTVVRVLRLDRGELRSWLCEVPSLVLRNAAAQVQVHRGHVDGPYFFTAVCRGVTIVRMHLRAIYFDGAYLFTVDSRFERGFGAHLINLGRVFYKPPSLSMRDYEAMPASVQLVPRALWIWVPDFLVSASSKDAAEIIEIEGFDDEAYLKQLARKMDDYSVMVRGTGVRAVRHRGEVFASIRRRDLPATNYPLMCGQQMPRFKSV